MTRRRRKDAKPEPVAEFAIVDGIVQPALPVTEPLRTSRLYAPPCPMCVEWRRLMGRGDDTVIIRKNSGNERYLRCGFCGHTWLIEVRASHHPLDE